MNNVSEQQSALPAANELLPAESWDYVPAKERFRENAISMGVVVGYGLVLSQIFNPTAFFVVSGLSLVMPTMMAFISAFPVDPSRVKSSEIPEEDRARDHYTAVTNEYAEAMGLPKQRFSFFTRYHLSDGASPWELFKLKYKKGYFEERIKVMACASLIDDAVLMSREMTQYYSDRTVNFVLTHELAHRKAKDERGVSSFTTMIAGCSAAFSKLLVLGTIAGNIIIPTFPSVFASGLNMVIGGVLFAVSTIATTLGSNYVSRIAERRADRNAVFITRDMQGAVDFLLDADKPAMKVPMVYEIKAHPSFGHRHQNIQDAFVLASQYEPVKLNLPEPPREVLESKNNSALKI